MFLVLLIFSVTGDYSVADVSIVAGDYSFASDFSVATDFSVAVFQC